MIDLGALKLDGQQQAARDWFEALRTRICAEFEAIEAEAGPSTGSGQGATFEYTPWAREDPDGAPGGGGVRGLMKGQVFEKVGVNVSTVAGRFSEEFARTIHGAGEDPSFFATGKYHHHVAANVWNSRGQPKREGAMTGLADYTIRFNEPAKREAAVRKLEELAIPTTRAGDTISLVDPWGIGLKLSA